MVSRVTIDVQNIQLQSLCKFEFDFEMTELPLKVSLILFLILSGFVGGSWYTRFYIYLHIKKIIVDKSGNRGGHAIGLCRSTLQESDHLDDCE